MSIFNDENKIKSNWFAFKNIDDNIEGTFIGKRQVPNQLKGALQWVYELLLDNGEVWNVGGKSGIDVQMRHIKLGQIIGFKFVEQRKPSKPGQQGTKIIQVFANPNVVNEQWLQDKAGQEGLDYLTDPNQPIQQQQDIDIKNVDFNEGSKPANGSDKLSLIGDLAKQKLGVTDPDKVQVEVMTKIGLAFIESNFEKIIEMLKAM